MDALSKGMERRIEKAPFLLRWLFRSEAQRLSSYERTIFSYFEHKTIISEQDRELIFHPERSKIKCIPNGIDESFFESIPTNSKFDLVFVGNLSYAPNVEAVEFIDDLLRTKKNLTCLVSGANPSSSVKKITSRNKAITLQGWTEDIRTAYCSGKIFIAPMMIGTGMQNKLLEAMALGIPCITTPLANNAIQGKNNQSILVAETKQDFIDCIEKLLSDQKTYESIKVEGIQHVRNNFSWKHSVETLKNDCFNTL
jgi:glycosyltransferase involved in cell wall biosynthesis